MNFDFSKPVGDPFVECGREALVTFTKQTTFSSENELLTIIKRLLKIYTQIWNQNKLASYWVHGANRRPADKTLALLKQIISVQPDSHRCVSCGKTGTVHIGDRTIFPLGFSGSNVNFSAHFSPSRNICKRCYLSLFALPLNAVMVAGKLLFVKGTTGVEEYWVEQNIKAIKRMFNHPKTESLITSDIHYLENFIYIFIEELVQEIPDAAQNDLMFYHFSNFATSPEMDVFSVYSHTAAFLQEITPQQFKDEIKGKSSLRDLWNRLIMRSFGATNLEQNDNQLILKEKKEFHVITFQEAKKQFRNDLISRFIQGKNLRYFIIKNFLIDIEKKSDSEKKEVASIYRELLFKYLIKVQQMDKERLDFIKGVAEKIATLDNANKLVGMIGRTQSLSAFRLLLIKIFKEYMQKHENKAPFSVDDLVFKLLPTGTYFAETRDILFVALYEQIAVNLSGEEIEEIELTKGEDDA